MITQLSLYARLQVRRTMFDYSLSTPRYQLTNEWSPPQRSPRPQYFKYPILFEWSQKHSIDISNDVALCVE